MGRKRAGEEMTYSNYLSLEAFANLLIRKEILTKEEIIEEITDW